MFKSKHIAITLLLIFCFAATGYANPLKCGEDFPILKLQGKLSSGQMNYLGLKGDAPWEISDIKSNYILIMIFSMYCPHCQKEAPYINDLRSRLIESGDEVKFIAVGAGNSDFEIDFFKKKYGIEIPLFSDSDLIAHEKTGSTGTPHFYLIKKTEKCYETLFSHAGRMKDVDSFAKDLYSAITQN